MHTKDLIRPPLDLDLMCVCARVLALQMQRSVGLWLQSVDLDLLASRLSNGFCHNFKQGPGGVLGSPGHGGARAIMHKRMARCCYGSSLASAVLTILLVLVAWQLPGARGWTVMTMSAKPSSSARKARSQHQKPVVQFGACILSSPINRSSIDGFW